MEKELPRPRDDRVIVDGNIVTSQAAGTAMEFAITLVQILAGRETASRTKKDLVFKD
jgi:4-methyl-5(b-hydroxyethyl)-thiazole monophosphate biosynthesis